MEWKDVPVFISSTFNDMHAERDYLVKYVFPELREWCGRRKLRLKDIDLRWGVTREDSQTKRTLGICLRDIDESRPFFLGMLGQRRGWQPTEKDIDEQTLRDYPQLPERIARSSVTEMEIEHALLEPLMRMVDDRPTRPIPAEHAVVFLREDSFTGSLNPAQMRVYTNWGEAAEGEDPLCSAAVKAADEDLRRFRERLERRAANTRHYRAVFDPAIPSPELGGEETEEGRGRLTDFRVGESTLKEAVTEALKAAILREYPERAEEAGESTAEEKRAFLEERIIEGYLERPADIRALDAYVEGGGTNSLVVHAPSGRGKTILLAWYARYLSREKELRAVFRSCGTGADTASVLGVFNSVFEQLGLEKALDRRELKEKMPVYMGRLCTGREPLVLILDALDQIPGGTELLSELPRILPPGLRLICSVRDEQMTGELAPEALEKQGFSLCEVSAFTETEDRRALADLYLRPYLKRLNPEETAQLLSKKGSDNPLYLKAALSELRILGRQSLIQERIASFGDTPEELFDAILERMEHDHLLPGVDGRKAVSLLFSLLSASRYGLGRAVMTEAFARAFPQSSPEELGGLIQVYLRQVREFLIQTDELTDLRFYAFRRAAAKRYAADFEADNALLAEAYLADIAPDFSGGGRTAFAEAVYHLLQAKDARAPALLQDIRFMRTKLALCGIQALLEDYETALAFDHLPERDRALLGAILKALRQSAYILEQRPWELPGQLSLRMVGESFPAFMENVRSHTESAWLRTERGSAGETEYTVLTRTDENIIGLYLHREGLLTVSEEGRVVIRSFLDGAVVRTIREGGMAALCVCRAGEALFLADTAGWLLKYDPDSGSVLAEGRIGPFPLAAICTDGEALFASDRRSGVFRIDPETLAVTGKRKLRGGVTAICADAEHVYLGGRYGRLLICDKDTLGSTRALEPHLGVITALYADEEYLYLGGCFSTVVSVEKESWKNSAEWDMDTDEPICQIFRADERVAAFSGVSARSFTPGLGRSAAPGGLVNSFRLCVRQGDRLWFVTAQGHLGYAHTGVLQEQGSGRLSAPLCVCTTRDRILMVSEEQGFRLFRRDSGECLELPGMNSEEIASACAWGDSFLLGRDHGEVMLLDGSGQMREFAHHPEREDRISNIRVRPMASGGRFAVWYRNGRLICMDMLSRESRELPKLRDCDSLCIDGRTLYAADGKKVHVMDLISGEEQRSFDIPDRAAKMIADGDRLYIARLPGLIESYSTIGGVRLETLFEGRVTDFAVRNGLMVVTSEDNTVRAYRDGALLTALTLDDVPYAMDMEKAELFIGTYGGGCLQLALENPDAPAVEDQTLRARGNRPYKWDRPTAYLKEQKWVWPVMAVLGLVFLGCAMAGLILSHSSVTDPRHGDWVAGLLILVMAIGSFGFRGIEAYAVKGFQRSRRILPSSFLLSASSALYLLTALHYRALGQIGAMIPTRTVWFVLMLVNYPYILSTVISIRIRFRTKIGWLDKLLERYLNIAALAGFAAMLLMYALAVLR